jgi:hypothetical protein
MSEQQQLHLTDVSSAEITSPPELSRIINISANLSTSTAECEVVNSDSMAPGSSVVRKPGIHKTVVKLQTTQCQDSNIIGKKRNRKKGVKRGSNSTNGEHTTAGKKFHRQQQRELGVVVPLEMVTTFSTSGTIPPVQKKTIIPFQLQAPKQLSNYSQKHTPSGFTDSPPVPKQPIISVQEQTCIAKTSASSGSDIASSVLGDIPPEANQCTTDPSGFTDLPSVLKQPLTSIRNDVVLKQTSIATTSASSGSDTTSSVSGAVPPAPNQRTTDPSGFTDLPSVLKQPLTSIQNDDVLKQTSIATTAASSGSDIASSVSGAIPPEPNQCTTDPSGFTDLPSVLKQPLTSIQKDVVLEQTSIATTAASSRSDTASSVSGAVPPAPNQCSTPFQRDYMMQQTPLSPNTASSISTMAHVNNSVTHALNPETIKTPPQPKVINLDELVIAPKEKQTIIDDVTDSSLDSYKRTVFGRASCIKPFPVKLLTGKPVISISDDINAYIHLVDMTSRPCCGYNYIFRLVDPVARYGHALPMKSNSTDDMESALKQMLLIARKHPKTVYLGQQSLDLLSRAINFPSIALLQLTYSPLMEAEMKKFSNQLAIWMEDNNDRWLFGLSAVQAVTNMLPLSVE